MKINYLLSRLTREKYINRWVILLIDLFLSVFSTVTSLALISYCLVLILVDCVLKKSCYRLSINVKKQTILS